MFVLFILFCLSQFYWVNVFVNKFLKISNVLHKVGNKNSIVIFLFSSQERLCPHFYVYYFLCFLFFFFMVIPSKGFSIFESFKKPIFQFVAIFCLFLVMLKMFFCLYWSKVSMKCDRFGFISKLILLKNYSIFSIWRLVSSFCFGKLSAWSLWIYLLHHFLNYLLEFMLDIF